MTQPQLAQQPQSHASPPDDGGDQGCFTRPEDTMVLPARSSGPAAPERAQSNAQAQGLMLTWIIGLALLVLLVMAVYLRGII